MGGHSCGVSPYAAGEMGQLKQDYGPKDPGCVVGNLMQFHPDNPKWIVHCNCKCPEIAGRLPIVHCNCKCPEIAGRLPIVHCNCKCPEIAGRLPRGAERTQRVHPQPQARVVGLP